MKTWNYLVIPLLSWTIAQVTKVTLESIKVRRINLRGLAETGGMPSSHSAIVAGLTTAVGRFDGLNSAAFAVALIITFVVMYDATGVRRAAGRQAAVLNRLVEDLFNQRGVREDRLRELLGHTPVEVLAGAALGALVGIAAP